MQMSASFWFAIIMSMTQNYFFYIGSLSDPAENSCMGSFLIQNFKYIYEHSFISIQALILIKLHSEHYYSGSQ